MNHPRILVHTKGTTQDAHIPQAMTRAVELARQAGINAIAVDSLPEIKQRLLLPFSDPSGAEAALSADNTARLLSVVRWINPILIRDPKTNQTAELPSPLAAILPTAKQKHPFVLSDAGAHLDLTPLQVAAGALLCGNFWKAVYHRQHPRYAVFGYGEEYEKLPKTAQAVHDLLSQNPKRTVKVAESKEAFRGDNLEVLVVPNAVIGNTILKTAEAVLEAFGVIVKEEITADLVGKLGGLLTRSAFQRAKDRLYHPEAHGALLLASGKPFMKHHGRMDSNALLLALLRLHRYTKDGVLTRMRESFFAELREFHPQLLPAKVEPALVR